MAATTFEGWLCEKLQNLNTDHEVFGSYIKGIMESEDSEDEKREALEGILSEVSEENLSDFCDEIFSKWAKFTQTCNGHHPLEKVDVDAKIASIMEEQAKVVVSGKQKTAEEKEYRDLILAQYSQVSDGEDNMNEDPGGLEGATCRRNQIPEQDIGLVAPNMNAAVVNLAEKEKRDKSKQEHEKKKAQDKLNKEKQKQQQQERKEKERKRTQKSEKRR